MADSGGIIRRSLGIGIILALSSLVASSLLSRWDWLLGLSFGSVLSLLNFRFLACSVTQWIGQKEKTKTPQFWKPTVLRLLMIGALLALGLLYIPMSILALMIGLFMAQVGLLLHLILPGRDSGEPGAA
jgi:hypothetical protein